MGNEVGKPSTGAPPRPAPSQAPPDGPQPQQPRTPPPPQPPPPPQQPPLPIVVLGASRVGKTSLIMRLCGARFDAACGRTLAPSRHVFTFKYGGEAHPVAATELPDQEDEDAPAAAASGAAAAAAAARLHCEGAALAIVIFDLRRAATVFRAEANRG